MKLSFFTRTGDKIVFWSLIALAVVTLTISALRQYASLALVHAELYLYLPLLVVLLLLGWGLSAIFRRIGNQTARRVVGAVMVLVMLVLASLGMTFAGVIAGYSFPQKYVDVVSPSANNRLIVLRAPDFNEERMNARHAARLAADPEGDPETIAEDWGYIYTAYAPAVMGLFYREDSLIDGEVCIGYASQAELMVEWEDGEKVAHFYVKNPEETDGGEMRVAC